MALGAQRSKILRMVLANGISLAVVGVLLGGAAAYLAAPLISGLLVEVSPHDPAVFALIALALIAATLGASWIPARRATRVNPMDALRSE
jgi:putative ABC transport system permease protein